MVKKKNPLVSVIIPVYNVKPFLEKSINSVVKQSYINLEIIVIDDGSNDGSSELLDKYINNNSKPILLKHIKNKGLSNARNTGINLATGDYLLFLDGDDWLDKSAIQNLINIIQNSESKIDLIMFPYVREFGNRSLKRQLFSERYKTFDNKEFEKVYRKLFGPIGDELKYPETLDILSTAWGKLYAKHIIKFPFEPYDIAYPEDILFNIKNLDRVKNAVYTESTYLHYNRSEQNSSAVTKSFNYDNVINSNKLMALLDEIIKDKKLANEYNDRLVSRIILRLFSFLLSLSTSSLPFRKKIEYANLIIKDDINKENVEKFNENIRLLPKKWQIFYLLLKKEKPVIIVGVLASLGKLRSIING